MPTNDSAKHITRGVMVSFDIFAKKDIEKINAKVSKTFDVEPTIKKSAFMGDSLETKNIIWKTESLSKVLATLRGICDEKRWTYDVDSMPKHIESFQVSGYDSPNFPFYILMAKITMKKNALNSCEDLRKDLFQASIAARLFIESLEGFRKKTTTFSPSSPLVTQLWIKVGKKELSRIREIEIALIDKEEKLSLDQKKTLSRKLRNLEPIDLSAPVGDVHSHIVYATNVTYVVGMMTQLGLGGFLSPYILYLSYDEKLLQQDLIETHLAPAEILVGGGIVRSEYVHLIGLISLSIYLGHLASTGEEIDQAVSELRDTITQKTPKKTLDQQLSEINEFGTRISSLQQIIGRFSRYWEGSIRRISENKDSLYLEVPVENVETFDFPIFTHKGYLGTLADQILATLNNITERLEKQGSEIASLRTHISDIVNLKNIKSNERLQKRMLWIALITLCIAIASFSVAYQSWRTAEIDYQRTHPEGEYFVSVYFLGYDSPTNNDLFRITIEYHGRGEARFLRLSIGVVGANPTVVSKGNVEVMEPDTILARNYVDGLIGWVDYNIQRVVSLNRTRLNIIDFSSDVSVRIKDNT